MQMDGGKLIDKQLYDFKNNENDKVINKMIESKNKIIIEDILKKNKFNNKINERMELRAHTRELEKKIEKLNKKKKKIMEEQKRRERILEEITKEKNKRSQTNINLKENINEKNIKEINEKIEKLEKEKKKIENESKKKEYILEKKEKEEIEEFIKRIKEEKKKIKKIKDKEEKKEKKNEIEEMYKNLEKKYDISKELITMIINDDKGVKDIIERKNLEKSDKNRIRLTGNIIRKYGLYNFETLYRLLESLYSPLINKKEINEHIVIVNKNNGYITTTDIENKQYYKINDKFELIKINRNELMKIINDKEFIKKRKERKKYKGINVDNLEYMKDYKRNKNEEERKKIIKIYDMYCLIRSGIMDKIDKRIAENGELNFIINKMFNNLDRISNSINEISIMIECDMVKELIEYYDNSKINKKKQELKIDRNIEKKIDDKEERIVNCISRHNIQNKIKKIRKNDILDIIRRVIEEHDKKEKEYEKDEKYIKDVMKNLNILTYEEMKQIRENVEKINEKNKYLDKKTKRELEQRKYILPSYEKRENITKNENRINQKEIIGEIIKNYKNEKNKNKKNEKIEELIKIIESMRMNINYSEQMQKDIDITLKGEEDRTNKIIRNIESNRDYMIINEGERKDYKKGAEKELINKYYLSIVLENIRKKKFDKIKLTKKLKMKKQYIVESNEEKIKYNEKLIREIIKGGNIENINFENKKIMENIKELNEEITKEIKYKEFKQNLKKIIKNLKKIDDMSKDINLGENLLRYYIIGYLQKNEILNEIMLDKEKTYKTIYGEKLTTNDKKEVYRLIEYKRPKGIADCGETTIRNLINISIYGKNRLNYENLNMIKEVREFYEMYDLEKQDEMTVHEEWLRIINNIAIKIDSEILNEPDAILSDIKATKENIIKIIAYILEIQDGQDDEILEKLDMSILNEDLDSTIIEKDNIKYIFKHPLGHAEMDKISDDYIDIKKKYEYDKRLDKYYEINNILIPLPINRIYNNKKITSYNNYIQYMDEDYNYMKLLDDNKYLINKMVDQEKKERNIITEEDEEEYDNDEDTIEYKIQKHISDISQNHEKMKKKIDYKELVLDTPFQQKELQTEYLDEKEILMDNKLMDKNYILKIIKDNYGEIQKFEKLNAYNVITKRIENKDENIQNMIYMKLVNGKYDKNDKIINILKFINKDLFIEFNDLDYYEEKMKNKYISLENNDIFYDKLSSSIEYNVNNKIMNYNSLINKIELFINIIIKKKYNINVLINLLMYMHDIYIESDKNEYKKIINEYLEKIYKYIKNDKIEEIEENKIEKIIKIEFDLNNYNKENIIKLFEKYIDFQIKDKKTFIYIFKKMREKYDLEDSKINSLIFNKIYNDVKMIYSEKLFLEKNKMLLNYNYRGIDFNIYI